MFQMKYTICEIPHLRHSQFRLVFVNFGHNVNLFFSAQEIRLLKSVLSILRETFENHQKALNLLQ